MLRRIALTLLALLVAVIGLWIALLTLLPDAPPDPGERLTGGRIAANTATLARRVAGLPPAPPGAAGAPLLAVPVQGIPREAIYDSWGDPRDNGLRAHHGTDIPAAPQTPVLAAAPGRVEKLWISAAGGTTVYVRSPKRQWIYYYAHLAGYAPGLHEGQIVRTGDLLGYVGDTGNAGAGNYHLHFGLARTLPEERWYQGRDVNPFPYLSGRRLAEKPRPR